MKNGKVIGTVTLSQATIVPKNLQKISSHLENVNNEKAEIRIDFCQTNNPHYCNMVFSLVSKTGKKIDDIATVKMPSANIGVLCATWMQILESQKEVK